MKSLFLLIALSLSAVPAFAGQPSNCAPSDQLSAKVLGKAKESLSQKFLLDSPGFQFDSSDVAKFANNTEQWTVYGMSYTGTEVEVKVYVQNCDVK